MQHFLNGIVYKMVFNYYNITLDKETKDKVRTVLFHVFFSLISSVIAFEIFVMISKEKKHANSEKFEYIFCLYRCGVRLLVCIVFYAVIRRSLLVKKNVNWLSVVPIIAGI